MGSFWFWRHFFDENQSAWLLLPGEAKQIIAIALILALGASLFGKAFRFLKYVLLAIAVYFGLNYFGVI